MPGALLWSAQPLPADLVAYVVRRCIKAFVDNAEARAPDLADDLEYLGLWILDERIGLVDSAVRSALSGDSLTEDDFVHLRRYPGDLATVERLAWRMDEPTVELTPRRDFYITPISMWGGRRQAIASEALAAIDRLSSLVASQQVVMVERQRLETARQRTELERFQRVATAVGAAVLVPTLVAGIFGTNVRFPGAGTAVAFWGVVALMLAGGAGSYGLLRLAELGARPPRLSRFLERWTPLQRAKAFVCLAVVSGALGVALLAAG